MHKVKSMKWPFAREDAADNLIEWAGKMKALAEVWGALSWHVDRCDGYSDALTHCGEYLGMIIMDYAGLIEDTVTDDITLFRPSKNITEVPIARCQEIYDFIGKTRRVEDLVAIDQCLKELKSFFENTTVPAIHLKNRFEELKKEMMDRKENAPAAVAAAGA